MNVYLFLIIDDSKFKVRKHPFFNRQPAPRMGQNAELTKPGFL